MFQGNVIFNGDVDTSHLNVISVTPYGWIRLDASKYGFLNLELNPRGRETPIQEAWNALSISPLTCAARSRDYGWGGGLSCPRDPRYKSKKSAENREQPRLYVLSATEL